MKKNIGPSACNMSSHDRTYPIVWSRQQEISLSALPLRIIEYIALNMIELLASDKRGPIRPEGSQGELGFVRISGVFTLTETDRNGFIQNCMGLLIQHRETSSFCTAAILSVSVFISGVLTLPDINVELYGGILSGFCANLAISLSVLVPVSISVLGSVSTPLPPRQSVPKTSIVIALV